MPPKAKAAVANDHSPSDSTSVNANKRTVSQGPDLDSPGHDATTTADSQAYNKRARTKPLTEAGNNWDHNLKEKNNQKQYEALQVEFKTAKLENVLDTPLVTKQDLSSNYQRLLKDDIKLGSVVDVTDTQTRLQKPKTLEDQYALQLASHAKTMYSDGIAKPSEAAVDGFTRHLLNGVDIGTSPKFAVQAQRPGEVTKNADAIPDHAIVTNFGTKTPQTVALIENKRLDGSISSANPKGQVTAEMIAMARSNYANNKELEKNPPTLYAMTNVGTSVSVYSATVTPQHMASLDAGNDLKGLVVKEAVVTGDTKVDKLGREHRPRDGFLQNMEDREKVLVAYQMLSNKLNEIK
ncbi:hypothetical protein HDV05_007194 [Chytridiales sp. JEL 0842]|nr:hypothetical protein HDV05_007194 [Chytridiales sp. JEL 0842]